MFRVILILLFALFSVCKCKSDDDLTITKFTRHDLFLNTDENRTKCVYYEMHYNRNNSLIKAKIINRTFSEFEFTDCIFNHFWIKRDSKGGKLLLRVLAKNASAIVPKSEIKLTQVYSYGNASLYIVPKPILHNFMNTMSSVFYHHKFQIKNIEPVLTLHPKLKVLLTWMALNFALGKGELTLEKTVAAAVFDPAMQGLIFIPSNKTKCEKLTHVGLPFKFYLYSILLSKNQTRGSIFGKENKKYIEKMSQNEKEIHKIKSACIRPFLEINITINGTHYVVVGKNSWMHKAHFNITIIDYHACKRTVQSFVEQLEKPESFKGKPFYAVRDYFTLALSTGLVSRPGGNVTMQKIEKKARDVCHDNTLEPFTCMDIIYMHSLFKKVYGLRKKSIIHFCEEVNGFDVDWRLAKAFSLYKGYNISSIDPVWHPDVLCPALKAKNSTTELNPTTTKPHLTIKHKQIKH